jgi:hypothetical protein
MTAMSDLRRSRQTLQQVAVHIVARARQQATGRFSLRVTAGGFGTPEFEPGPRRVRVASGTLIVESDAPGAARTGTQAIAGSSLRQLADLAEVDLGRELDVGADTPELGDLDAPLRLDTGAASAVTGWFAHVALVLDRVLTALPSNSEPSLVRLWPEHFDVAVDVAARSGLRVNLGGSPGDSFSDEPYVYVGPWTGDRPGDASFWNAPFGAARSEPDPDRAVDFLLDGVARLAAQN